MELKYMDKVKITKGFYSGLEGCVHDERDRLSEGFSTGKRYRVALEMNDETISYEITKWINEDCLEKIKEGK